MTQRCWPILAGLLGLVPSLGCLNNMPRSPSLEMPSLSNNAAERPAPELPAAKSAQVCLRMAATMEGNGHEAEAAMEYERARQYDPRLRQVARRLATLYDRLGIHQRSLEEFQKALKDSPKDADLINDLGFSYYNRGQWAEAEKYFRQALALNARHARAWNNLGLTLGQLGRFPEALEAFQHVVTPAEAHSNLAFVLSTQGKGEEARQEYRLALSQEPDLRIAQLALERLEKPAAALKPVEPGPRAKPGRDDSVWRPEAKPPEKVAAASALPPPSLPDLAPVIVDLPKPKSDSTLPPPVPGPVIVDLPKPKSDSTLPPPVPGPVIIDLPKPKSDLTVPPTVPAPKKDAAPPPAPPKPGAGIPGTISFE